jgi:hypothetical protein
MKHLTAVLFLLALLHMAAAPAVAGSKDEKNLEKEIAGLSRTALEPKGEPAVMMRITSDFKVAPERVRSLRDRGLSYGEVAVVLSFVQMMPGGITDQNIDRLLALRQGPPAVSWGAAAERLGLKVGKTVSQVKKINNETHRLMKQSEAPPAASPPGEREEPRRGPAKQYPGEGKSLHPED